LRAGGVFLSSFMLRCKISPGIAMTKVRFGSKTDVALVNRDVRFTPNSGHRLSALGIGSLNRSPRWRRLADYSREDAKSCNAIPAKRFSAPRIRQMRSTQSAICWSGKGFLWHCFWARCKVRRQTQAFPNIPFEGDDLY
jgi:hypothetical protein